MSDKPSRLGRGLGDLLDDNNPTMRSQNPYVIVRGSESKDSNKVKSSPRSASANSLYDTTPKPLFESKPRNKSLK